jgi:hypothetical protein
MAPFNKKKPVPQDAPSQDAPSITELLNRAKAHIEAGESRLHAAARDIAAAYERGATQREIAEAVNKSAAWVNGLLKWRRSGWADTPFGPQSKTKRDHVQAPKQNRKPSSADEKSHTFKEWDDKAKADPAFFARSEAAKAKAEAAAARARAQKAKAEAAEAKARARQSRDQAHAEMFGRFHRKPAEIHSSTRTLLIKALGMLGSEHAGERDNAARMVETQRKKLGMEWEDLIIEATPQTQKAAA